MKLSWFVLALFALGFIVSGSYAGGGGPAASGWIAALLISALGVAWTAFLEWESQSPSRPAEPANLAAVPAVETPAPAPLAAPAAPPTPFQEYFERAPLPLLVIDRTGRIQRMNHAAESVTEFATAEVRSEPYWNIFLSGDPAVAAEDDYRQDMLARHVPVRREAWKTRTGASAVFEWWRTLLKDEYGQGAGVLAAGLPVADAASPVDLSALADQLTAVNGYSELLLMSVGAEDPIRGDLETIHRAGLAAKVVLEPPAANSVAQ